MYTRAYKVISTIILVIDINITSLTTVGFYFKFQTDPKIIILSRTSETGFCNF